MCTLVLSRRPGYSWPLIVAANRDEMESRPWKGPGRHWPDRPHVVAGLDLEAGGSWLGLNDEGVIAAVLNRPGALGPVAGKRSRGELVLEALDQVEAALAAEMLSHLDPAAYRPFNLVIADESDAFILMNRDPEGGQRIVVRQLPAGLTLVANTDPNDMAQPRIRTYSPLFQSAPHPDPASGEWTSWERLLAARFHDPDSGPLGAMCIVTDRGYGTVSGSLLAVPSGSDPDLRAVWRFCPGRPGEAEWAAVRLD